MFQHGMCGCLESVFIFLSREEPGISIFKVFLAWLSYISLLKVELWKFLPYGLSFGRGLYLPDNESQFYLEKPGV